MQRLELDGAYVRVDTSPSIRNLLTTATLLGLLPALGGFFAATAGGTPIGALFAVPAVAAFAARSMLGAREVLGVGSVAVDEARIELRGRRRSLSIPLVDVVSGARSPEERGIRLDLRDGRSVLVVPGTDADLGPLLRATGTSVRRRVAVFPLRGSVRPALAGVAYFAGFVGFLALLVHLANRAGARLDAGTPLVVTILGLGLAFTGALLTIPRPRLVVGLDGVRIHFALRRCFIAHEDILRVDVQPDPAAAAILRIEARHATVALPLFRTPAADIARMVLRIQHGIDAARDGGAAAREVPAGTFARGRQSIRGWRDALANVLDKGTDYRRAPITAAAAEAVVADPRAALDDRIGAALALRIAGTKRAERLARRAATSSADETAKRAFEAIAAGDDDALDAATDAIERRLLLGEDATRADAAATAR